MLQSKFAMYHKTMAGQSILIDNTTHYTDKADRMAALAERQKEKLQRGNRRLVKVKC